MSKKMIIKNEKLSEYLGTNDAIRGLEKVVNNGQTRLALEVLFEIVEELTERISTVEDNASSPPTPVHASDVNVSKPVTKTKETNVEILEQEKK